MADALCGPSNALSSFSKHAATDRSLQQDRLVSRHESTQGFRSAGGSRQGDAEFDAFQRGDAQRLGMPVPMPMSMPIAMPMGRGMDMHVPQQRQMGAPMQSQAPDWASDFQRLSLAGQSQHVQQKSAAPAWHLDFARQQQAPAPAQQNSYSSVGGYGQSMGMGMGMGMSGFAGPAYTQTAQHAPTQLQQQQPTPTFDEAAFEAAFEQAQRDAAVEADAQLAAETEQSALSAQAASMDRPGETDPLLARVREARPAVYSAIQVWSETGLGRTDEATAILDHMLSLEHTGSLVTDAFEGRWIVDSLRRIAETDVHSAVQTRADALITAINQRLMSQYPLNTALPRTDDALWNELNAAGYTHIPTTQPAVPAPAQEQQAQEQPHADPDADEMAATAGRLLESVSDNTSEKFQNSQFLALMRRLRDREVKVQGDGLVDVEGGAPSSATTTTTQPQHPHHPPTTQPSQAHPSTYASASASSIPPIDPHILSHAATDFQPPTTYPDDDDTFENAAR